MLYKTIYEYYIKNTFGHFELRSRPLDGGPIRVIVSLIRIVVPNYRPSPETESTMIGN